VTGRPSVSGGDERDEEDEAGAAELTEAGAGAADSARDGAETGTGAADAEAEAEAVGTTIAAGEPTFLTHSVRGLLPRDCLLVEETGRAGETTLRSVPSPGSG